MQNKPQFRQQLTSGEQDNAKVNSTESGDCYGNAELVAENSYKYQNIISQWLRDYSTTNTQMEFQKSADAYRILCKSAQSDGKEGYYLGRGGKSHISRKNKGAKVVFLLIFFPILIWICLHQNVTSGILGICTYLQKATISSETSGIETHMTSRKSLIQLKTLNPTHLPSHNSHHSSRLIVVGDVHGCKVELLKLLNKVDFSPKWDHLILAGDMIDKGPDSNGVVRLARGLGASCVRGNHENSMLLQWETMNAGELALIPDEDNDDSDGSLALTELFMAKSSFDKELEDDDDIVHAPYRRLRESAFSKRALHTDPSDFSKASLRFLAECPVILRVGNISSMPGEVNVVHAGLAPNIHLADQDPEAVMTMRTIDLNTDKPSPERDGKGLSPWWKAWNSEQKRLSPSIDDLDDKEFDTTRKSTKKQKMPRRLVVYGHDSKTGLNIQKYSVGLDTGCVKGGRLSGLVIEVDKKGRAMHKVVSVRCSEYA